MVPEARRVIEIAGERAYSLPALADELGYKVNTIERWKREGKLRCTKIGRHWYVHEEEARRLVRYGFENDTESTPLHEGTD